MKKQIFSLLLVSALNSFAAEEAEKPLELLPKKILVNRLFRGPYCKYSTTINGLSLSAYSPDETSADHVLVFSSSGLTDKKYKKAEKRICRIISNEKYRNVRELPSNPQFCQEVYELLEESYYQNRSQCCQLLELFKVK